jgi:murein DD-endopeptidase MepM/ murein hydrolase activator NlpD
MSENSENSKYIYTPNFVFKENKEKNEVISKIKLIRFSFYFNVLIGFFQNLFSGFLFLILLLIRSVIKFFIDSKKNTASFFSDHKNLSKNDFRSLWLLNFKVNKIIYRKRFLKFWNDFSVVAKSSYLAIFVLVAVFGLKIISLNSSTTKNSESFLNRILNKYSFIDRKTNILPTNFVSIAASAKKLDDPIRLIRHKTVEGDTIMKIAEKYGLQPETVAINNHILNFDKDKPLDKDKDIYLPWQDSYIYLAKEDIEPKKLAEIFQIDENKIYSNNEDIINIETSKFSKNSLVLIPTQNFDLAKKYEELEKIKQGLDVTGDKSNDEKKQKLAENYASETNGSGKYSGSKSDQKSAGFIWPAAGNLTRCLESGHIACDIANATNPPVFAAQDAVVKDVYRYTVYGYGLAVLLSHANGTETLYAHLNDIYVSRGQSVFQGQSIGQMGSTGNSTGTHLHFEVRIGGVKQNPLNYLP